MKRPAMSQAERDAKAAAKRLANAETELRHRVRPGIKAMLAELMQWHGIEEQAEALQLLIINAHAAGPEGSSVHLKVPRHEITLSESVARKVYKQGKREAERLDNETES